MADYGFRAGRLTPTSLSAVGSDGLVLLSAAVIPGGCELCLQALLWTNNDYGILWRIESDASLTGTTIANANYEGCLMHGGETKIKLPAGSSWYVYVGVVTSAGVMANGGLLDRIAGYKNGL